MPKKTVNVTLDRHLWDSLSKFAWDQCLISGKRFSTIKALRVAIQTFLKMTPNEINQTLNRVTHNTG